MTLDYYREIWVADFEFQSDPGEQPVPICGVFREWRTGRVVRLWQDELRSGPPFTLGPDVLFCAFVAQAELSCFLALGWPVPCRILDLLAEFRCLTNGLELPAGRGLLGAAVWFGLDHIDAAEKESMRSLALRGGPYTADERRALLDYCEADVTLTAKLLSAMAERIDLPRALLRGRYTLAVAHMEWQGVPIDADTLAKLQEHWESVKAGLIGEVDRDFGLYDGSTFKADRFAAWLARHGIPWPRLASGALDMSQDALRESAKVYPAVAPIRELRHTLGELRLFDLAVGVDRRNRCSLWPFSSKTSRNQPGNSAFIFGPSCWLRGLIRPERGRAVAYIDYERQEFGVAAALSGDEAMMATYRAADPYLDFAIRAGAAPVGATKQTHAAVREQFKIASLAVLYGMGPGSLGQRIGQSSAHARELLRLHKMTFPRFWQWSQAAVDHATLRGKLWTVFGWEIRPGRDPNPRSLANFPVQANGAEIMRLACCELTEAGVAVCCPVHDAVLIEADTDDIDATVAKAREIMERASERVLGGFRLGTDAKIVRWPDRYMDERGRRMWDTVMGIVARRIGEGPGGMAEPNPADVREGVPF